MKSDRALKDLSRIVGDTASHKASRRHRCKQSKCLLEGKETLELSPGSSIYQGLFTIYYQENDLRRSLSFRIPVDV